MKRTPLHLHQVFKTGSALLAALIASAHLTGCGGGSGTTLAGNGGISGSGLTSGSGGGEITGFGSVIFDDSTFEIDDSTVFTIDGVEVSGQDDLGTGMFATFEIGDDASMNLATGTALRIDASTAVKGVVTNVSPLEVLGLSIVATGDTVLDSIPSNNLASLVTGDLVEVYGIVDAENLIRATRIEYKTLDGLLEWKLTGTASNVSSNSVTIGTQAININGVVIDDCTGGLSNGDFIEVKATPNPGFSQGNTLNLVSKVECQARGIPVPTNPSASVIPAQFEGVVSGYTGAGDPDFYLGEQLVELTGTIIYRNGTSEDLVNGVRLEAEGLFNTSNRVLSANKIKFKQTRLRIEAPVGPADVTLGTSIEILGLTVIGTAATEDDDNILSAASGLPAQVEVRGFVDSSGTLYAEAIRERGNQDSNDVRLRGPIDNIANPALDVLGVPVDLSGALAYLDASGTPLADIDAFFALLSTGDIIQVEDAQLNAGPSLSMDTDTTAEIED